MARKAAIAATIFIAPASTELVLRDTILLMILISAIATFTFYKPYASDELDKVESVSLISSGFSIVFSSFVNSRKEEDTWTRICTIGLLAVNAWFLAFFVPKVSFALYRTLCSLMTRHHYQAEENKSRSANEFERGAVQADKSVSVDKNAEDLKSNDKEIFSGVQDATPSVHQQGIEGHTNSNAITMSVLTDLGYSSPSFEIPLDKEMLEPTDISETIPDISETIPGNYRMPEVQHLDLDRDHLDVQSVRERSWFQFCSSNPTATSKQV